jgi:thiol-disulfide isomerase/thioredoxin
MLLLFIVGGLSGWAQVRPTLSIFYLEDCIICQSFTPELNKLYKKFHERVDFVLIFPNHRSKDKTIKEFINKYKIDIPYKTDHYKKVSSLMGVSVTPEVVLTDSLGQIIYQGAIDDSFISPGKKRKAKNHYLQLALEASIANKRPEIAKTQAVGCFINYKEND